MLEYGISSIDEIHDGRSFIPAMVVTESFTGASGLLEALAEQPGLTLREGEPLARRTTFRIGGPAEIFAEVANEEALSVLLAEVDLLGAPFFLLGIGSNVLLPDKGLPGVVAQLGGEFSRIEFEGCRVRAGGAASLPKLARASVRKGLSGLESLAGFPSTVGGAVRMNAGSYGTEICDLVETVRVADRQGIISELSVDDVDPGYRTTRLQRTGQIVIDVRLVLEAGDADAAAARIAELNRKRWQSLPSGLPNAGSIFRNPSAGPAGKLIDECGLKGASAGGARISPGHGNVIVNDGGARAGDVLDLMVRMCDAVAERFGVLLEPEIVLAGELRDQWRNRTAAIRRRLIAAAAD